VDTPVYSTNRAVFAENIGRRLENLFWRIWSSERLLGRISGQQVAIQFSRINEGGYIRTTPTQSPRSSRAFGERRTQAPMGASSASAPQSTSDASTTANPPKGHGEEGRSTPTLVGPPAHVPRQKSALSTSSALSTEAGFSENPMDVEEDTETPPSSVADAREPASSKDSRRPAAERPPPILKKNPSSGSSRSSTNAALVPAGSESQSNQPARESGTSAVAATSTSQPFRSSSPPAKKYTSTRFSEQVAVSIPKAPVSSSKVAERSSRTQGESSQKSVKRNPVIHASSGASKRRPAIVRHRSSQSSQDSPKEKKSPSPPSPVSTQPTQFLVKEDSEIAVQDPESNPEKGKQRASSPHPSRRRKDDYPESEASSEEAMEHSDNEETQQPGQVAPLVEPNFRSKFAERKGGQHRSFTNLPSLTQKSSAAGATAASFQASGLMDFGQASSTRKGKGKGTAREAFTDEIIPLKAPGPVAPECSDTNTSEPLPRTKSQLTLLLERSKAATEDKEKGNP